jgi:hypothetical protein
VSLSTTSEERSIYIESSCWIGGIDTNISTIVIEETVNDPSCSRISEGLTCETIRESDNSFTYWFTIIESETCIESNDNLISWTCSRYTIISLNNIREIDRKTTPRRNTIRTIIWRSCKDHEWDENEDRENWSYLFNKRGRREF